MGLPFPLRNRILGVMLVESIREFNHRIPFQPYEIHMAGGDRFVVPHPDFVLVSPKGHFVITVDSKERPHHLNSFLIERVSPVRNGQRRKRAA